MANPSEYLFKSERLGFRNWLADDIKTMTDINSNPEVMEFFPSVQSEQETAEFIDRMQKHFLEGGFCYFAVDKLENNEFIGFVGLFKQTFESDFTPCIDIGWRLTRKEWNKGFATEGARRCLDFAFKQLQLEKVNAVAPVLNSRSEQVMKKIGMKKVKTFKHPKLIGNERLQECVLYEIAIAATPADNISPINPD
jgi:RimJ/RimL family protein N-acetyltransferase